jgi:hypothetical protein
MRILKESGGPSAGLALPALIIALSLGCGGGGEAPPSPAPPAASAPEYAPSAQPSGTLPLVDSRGDTVQAAAGGESAGGSDDLTWTVPAAWVTETPSSGMRRAQYALPAAAGDPEGGECAVFYFGPGQGGDIQSNVNRWASQFSAPGGHPTPELTETVVAGRKVLKVTMEGTYNASTMMGGDAVPKPGSLLLGAIVEGPAGNWFFKCTGPKKTMLAQGKEFESLIQSVRPK